MAPASYYKNEKPTGVEEYRTVDRAEDELDSSEIYNTNDYYEIVEMATERNNIAQIIHDTQELVNDSAMFEWVSMGIYCSLEKTVQLRLSKWLSFFNERYSKCICIYSSSVDALFEAAKNNELFRTQTGYEFEICLSFYEKLFNAKFFKHSKY